MTTFDDLNRLGQLLWIKLLSHGTGDYDDIVDPKAHEITVHIEDIPAIAESFEKSIDAEVTLRIHNAGVNEERIDEFMNSLFDAWRTFESRDPEEK